MSENSKRPNWKLRIKFLSEPNSYLLSPFRSIQIYYGLLVVSEVKEEAEP
jgi:hypothetical protein